MSTNIAGIPLGANADPAIRELNRLGQEIAKFQRYASQIDTGISPPAESPEIERAGDLAKELDLTGIASQVKNFQDNIGASAENIRDKFEEISPRIREAMRELSEGNQHILTAAQLYHTLDENTEGAGAGIKRAEDANKKLTESLSSSLTELKGLLKLFEEARKSGEKFELADPGKFVAGIRGAKLEAEAMAESVGGQLAPALIKQSDSLESTYRLMMALANATNIHKDLAAEDADAVKKLSEQLKGKEGVLKQTADDVALLNERLKDPATGKEYLETMKVMREVGGDTMRLAQHVDTYKRNIQEATGASERLNRIQAAVGKNVSGNINMLRPVIDLVSQKVSEFDGVEEQLSRTDQLTIALGRSMEELYSETKKTSDAIWEIVQSGEKVTDISIKGVDPEALGIGALEKFMETVDELHRRLTGIKHVDIEEVAPGFEKMYHGLRLAIGEIGLAERATQSYVKEQEILADNKEKAIKSIDAYSRVWENQISIQSRALDEQIKSHQAAQLTKEEMEEIAAAVEKNTRATIESIGVDRDAAEAKAHLIRMSEELKFTMGDFAGMHAPAMIDMAPMREMVDVSKRATDDIKGYVTEMTKRIADEMKQLDDAPIGSQHAVELTQRLTEANEKLKEIGYANKEVITVQKDLNKTVNDYEKVMDRVEASGSKAQEKMNIAYEGMGKQVGLIREQFNLFNQDLELSSGNTKQIEENIERWITSWKSVNTESNIAFQMVMRKAAVSKDLTKYMADMAKMDKSHGRELQHIAQRWGGINAQMVQAVKQYEKMEIVLLEMATAADEHGEALVDPNVTNHWEEVVHHMRLGVQTVKDMHEGKIELAQGAEKLQRIVAGTTEFFRQNEDMLAKQGDQVQPILGIYTSLLKTVGSVADRGEQITVIEGEHIKDAEKKLQMVRQMEQAQREIATAIGHGTASLEQHEQVIEIIMGKMRELQQEIVQRGFISEDDIRRAKELQSGIDDIHQIMAETGKPMIGELGRQFKELKKETDGWYIGLVQTHQEQTKLAESGEQLGGTLEALTGGTHARVEAIAKELQELHRLQQAYESIESLTEQKKARYEELTQTTQGFFGALRRVAGMSEESSSKFGKVMKAAQGLAAIISTNISINTQYRRVLAEIARVKGENVRQASFLSRGMGVLVRGFGHFATGMTKLMPIIGTFGQGVIRAGGAVYGMSRRLVSFGRQALAGPARAIYTLRQLFVRWYVTVVLFTNMLGRLAGDILEFQRNVIRATSLAGEGFSEFNNLMDVSLNLIGRFPVSANEVSAALMKISQAGFRGAEIPKILEPATRLAVVFGGDLGPAIDVTIAVLRTFGLEADQSAHVMNVLGNAASMTNMTIHDLSTAMGYAGPAAEAMGVSFEQATMLTSVLRESGLRASRAGTNLRMIFSNLTQAISDFDGPAMSAVDALKLLGIEQEELMATQNDAVGIFALMRRGMAQVSEEQGKAAMIAIAGKRAYGSLSRMVNMSTEELRQREKAITETSQIEQKAAEISEKGAIALQRLGSLWTLFRAELVNAITPALDSLGGSIDKVTDLMRKLGENIGNQVLPYIQKAIDWIIEFIGEGGLEEAANFIMEVFHQVVEVAKWVWGVIGEMIDWVGGALSDLGAISGKEFGTAKGLLDAVMNILIIIGGVLVFVFGKFIAIGAAIAVIAASPIGDVIKELVFVIVRAWRAFFGAISGVVGASSGLGNILQRIADVLRHVIVWAIERVFAMWKALLPAVMAVGILIKGIWGLLKPIVALVFQLFEIFWDLLMPVVKLIGVLLLPIAGILYIVLKVVGFILNIFVQIVAKIAEWVKMFSGPVLSAVNRVFRWIMRLFGGVSNEVDAAGNAGKSVGENIADGVEGGLDSALAEFKKFGAKSEYEMDSVNPMAALWSEDKSKGLDLAARGAKDCKTYTDGITGNMRLDAWDAAPDVDSMGIKDAAAYQKSWRKASENSPINIREFLWTENENSLLSQQVSRGVKDAELYKRGTDSTIQEIVKNMESMFDKFIKNMGEAISSLVYNIQNSLQALTQIITQDAVRSTQVVTTTTGNAFSGLVNLATNAMTEPFLGKERVARLSGQRNMQQYLQGMEDVKRTQQQTDTAAHQTIGAISEYGATPIRAELKVDVDITGVGNSEEVGQEVGRKTKKFIEEQEKIIVAAIMKKIKGDEHDMSRAVDAMSVFMGED